MTSHTQGRPGREELRQVFERVFDHFDGGGSLASLDIATLWREVDETRGDAVEEALRRLRGGASVSDLSGLERRELEAIYALGESALNAGRVDTAQRLFRFLCGQCHLEGRYWLALGIVQARLERLAEALQAFAMGALVTADDPRFPLNSAEVHLRLGDAEAARSGAKLAIALAGGSEFAELVERRGSRVLAALDARGAEEGK